MTYTIGFESAISMIRTEAWAASYPSSNQMPPWPEWIITSRIEELIKRPTVSLNATEMLRAVVLACLSLAVTLLMKNLSKEFTTLMDIEATTDKN